jgi:uncharacterized protein
MERLTIPLEGAATVSGLLMVPPASEVCLVLAHSAGAGMARETMEKIAVGLGERGVCTLR